MTDTTQPSTPPPNSSPSAPTAPAAPAEVVVNQAPVDQPSPIGNQAPPKPDGAVDNKSSSISRREAIQKAFDRAKQSQAEADEKPERKTQPVARKEGDRAQAPEKKAQQQPEKQPQHREAGRFARDPGRQQPGEQQAQPGQQQPGQQQPGQQPQQKYQPLAENAPFRNAPQRFSPQAQADWAGAPESVRGAVHQMAREFQGAYEKYRGDVETMNSIRPYHELAKKQGTSVDRVLRDYVAMENKLRSDLIGGFAVIVNNSGMKNTDGSPTTLYDVAHHIVSMTPEQHQMTFQRNQQSATDMRMGQLLQTVEQLSKGFAQMQYGMKYQSTRAQVDAFAEKHPRFDELSDLIKQELDLGFPLEVAYQRADRLRPSTQAAQTRAQSAQTRRTSISGAPDGGKPVNTRSSDERRKANGEAKHPTRREAIANAMRRVSNGV